MRGQRLKQIQLITINVYASTQNINNVLKTYEKHQFRGIAEAIPYAKLSS